MVKVELRHPMLKKVCFVSDLHLLSQRSVADQHNTELRLAAKRSDVFVLGGDIFDFKWSKLATAKASFAYARKWVEDFVHPFPQVKFHYLLGNHDCCQPFVKELELIEKSVSNFQVNPNTLQIGTSVFLHGDVVHGPPTQAALETKRRKWALKSRKGPVKNALYDLVTATRIHRFLARTLNPSNKLASKLLMYLEATGHDVGSINDVYFGHTHWNTEFDFQGVRFHNGGAAIRGLSFRWIEFEIEI